MQKNAYAYLWYCTDHYICLHVCELEFPSVSFREELLHTSDEIIVVLTDQAYFPCMPGKTRIHKEQLMLQVDSLQARLILKGFFYAFPHKLYDRERKVIMHNCVVQNNVLSINLAGELTGFWSLSTLSQKLATKMIDLGSNLYCPCLSFIMDSWRSISLNWKINK